MEHQAPDPRRQGSLRRGLGASTALAARLYQVTGKTVYLEAALKFITWANGHILKWDGSYADRIPREVIMPTMARG